MDLKSQYTCPEPGCGNHGTCNSSTGNCDCEPGWSGLACQIAPRTNVPCTPSSKEFKDAHDGGDLDCGNWGQFGLCNTNGTCSCGYVDPFYGNRCHQPCRIDSDCGGYRPDAKSSDGKILNRIIGTCSTLQTCECKNGWSGLQCRDAPDINAPNNEGICLQDSDCQWGGKSRGACDLNSGKCICTRAPGTGQVQYKGNFCEQIVMNDGSPCNKDSDCESAREKCINNMCYGDNGNVPKQNVWDVIGETAANIFFTEQGVETLALFMGIPKVANFLLSASVSTALKNQVEQEMSEIINKESWEKISNTLTEGMTAKVAAQLFAKDAAERTVDTTITVATDNVLATVFSPLGLIMSMMDILMIISLVLDSYDVAGLNLQMSQSILDAMQLKFYQSMNNAKEYADLGISIPRAYFPMNTIPFKIKTQESAMKDQAMVDMNDYLGRLVVNSDGQIIIPAFYDPTAQKRNKLREKYSLYWKMARNNNAVFDNLVSLGWLMWLLISLVISLGIVTLVVGSLKKKIKKKD